MMCTQALFSHCGAHIPLQMYVYPLFIKLNGKSNLCYYYYYFKNVRQLYSQFYTTDGALFISLMCTYLLLVVSLLLLAPPRALFCLDESMTACIQLLLFVTYQLTQLLAMVYWNFIFILNSFHVMCLQIKNLSSTSFMSCKQSKIIIRVTLYGR